MRQNEFEAEAARLKTQMDRAHHPKKARLAQEREEFMGKNAPSMTFFQAVKYLAKNRKRALFFNAGGGDGPFTDEQRDKFWSIIYSDESGSDGNEIFAYVASHVARCLIEYRCVYLNSYGGYKSRKIHGAAPEACIGHLNSKFRVLNRDRRIYSLLGKAKVAECKNIEEMFNRFNEAGFKGSYYTRRDTSGSGTNTFYLIDINNSKRTVMFDTYISARPKQVASVIEGKLKRLEICLGSVKK